MKRIENNLGIDYYFWKGKYVLKKFFRAVLLERVHETINNPMLRTIVTGRFVS